MDKVNGPAFPHEYKYGDGTAHRCDGMTLRDYFAAKAMQGWLASFDPSASHPAEVGNTHLVAAAAYAMADAMLVERNK